MNGDVSKQNATETRSALFHSLVKPEEIECNTRSNIHETATRNQNNRADGEADRPDSQFDGRTNRMQRHAIKSNVHQAEMEKRG